MTDYQWYKGYADVIDKLVTKCWQEEACADEQLRKVTKIKYFNVEHGCLHFSKNMDRI